MSKNKKAMGATAVAASSLALLLGTTAFAAVPTTNGTVVVGTTAYSMDYLMNVKDAAKIKAIQDAIGATATTGNLYFSMGQGTWKDVMTGTQSMTEDQLATKLGATTVTYVHADGTTTNETVGTATAALSVSSVSAINAKQLQVKFNKAITDRVAAEKVANYTIAGQGVSNPTFSAQLTAPDTVTLTINMVNNSADVVKMANGYDYTVTTSKDLLGTTQDQQSKTTFSDTSIPTVASLKTLSTSQIQVNFSEPIDGSLDGTNAARAAHFTLVELDKDGKEVTGTYTIDSATMGTNNQSAILSLNSTNPIKPGVQYRLYTNKDKALKDFAGYVVAADGTVMTYQADTTVPQATGFTMLDQQYAVVTFNKPVQDLSTSNFFWNADGIQTNVAYNATSVTRLDAQTFKVRYNLIPAGVKYFFVANATDYAGNIAPISKFQTTIADTVSPKVVSATLTSTKTIKVTLNEDIQDANTVFAADAAADVKAKGRAFYNVTGIDGNTALINSVAYGLKSDNVTIDYSTRIITLYSDLQEGNNSIKVTGIKDALLRVLPDFTTPLKVDSMPNLYASVYSSIVANTNNLQMLVNLDETNSTGTPVETGAGSILDPSNWIVTTQMGTTKTLADIGGTVTKSSNTNDSYVLQGDKSVLSTGAIEVVGLKNTDGKTIAPSTFSVNAAPTMDLSTSFVKSKTIAKDKITLTVKGLLANVNPSDFRLMEDNLDKTTDYVQSVTYANNYGVDTVNAVTGYTSTITITFKNNIDPANHTYGIKTNSTGIGTVDQFGNKLVASTGVVVQDTTAANIIQSYVDNNNVSASNKSELTLVLDKTVAATTLNANDFKVTKADGTVLAIDSVTANGTKNVTVKLASVGTVPAPAIDATTGEVKVTFTKNLSSANVASTTVTTDSMRLTGVSFGSGMYAGLAEGSTSGDYEDYVVLTFNKLVNPDVLAKIGSSDSAIDQASIKTAFGTLLADSAKNIYSANPSDTITYVIDPTDGHNVIVKLDSLNGQKAGDSSSLTFTTASALADSTVLNSVDGIPVVANEAIVNINPAKLIAPMDFTATYAPASNLITVANNWACDYASGSASGQLSVADNRSYLDFVMANNATTHKATITATKKSAVTLPTTGNYLRGIVTITPYSGEGIAKTIAYQIDATGNVSFTNVIDATLPTVTVPTAAATGNNMNDGTKLVVSYGKALYNNGVAIVDGADVKSLFTYDGTAGNYTSATYDATNKTVTFVLTAGETTKKLTTATTVSDAYGNIPASTVFTYTAGSGYAKN